MAKEAGLDLVEVSPTAEPPVCKIMDFGRYRYALRKRDKESRKKTHFGERKEIRLRPKTDSNDLNRKLQHGRELLLEGYRLQLTMRLRGREMAFSELASQLLDDAVAQLADIATLESKSSEGRQIIAQLIPKKQPSSKPARPAEPGAQDERKNA